MKLNKIKISPILSKTTSKNLVDCYTVLWIQDGAKGLEINKSLYKNVSNAVFFLHSDYQWKIIKTDTSTSSGYILYIPISILNHPTFNNLHITEICLLNTSEIPKINLAPGIEVRIKAILEMLDKLVSTRLKHREDAIISLLKTFFIYCDGKCNIKSIISDNNAKSALVYRLKKTIDQNITKHHDVSYYADTLHVTSKYLNECVKEVLGVNVKNLIDEQLVMHARHYLKFSDHNIKEIAYTLGFSSTDYFSYFFKRHTGITPSKMRQS